MFSPLLQPLHLMLSGRTGLTVKALGGPVAVGIGAAAVAVAIVIAAGPVSALWKLYDYHQAPGARRVEATVMSSRAGHAFDSARTAISSLTSARSLEDRHKALTALEAAQQAFSRDMARAADASVNRRAEILSRKTKGEVILGVQCAPWTGAIPTVAPDQNSKAASLRSQFLYFKTCLAESSRFQQALDDQTATIVADMTQAAVAVVPKPGAQRNR